MTPEEFLTSYAGTAFLVGITIMFIGLLVAMAGVVTENDLAKVIGGSMMITPPLGAVTGLVVMAWAWKLGLV